MAIVKPFHGIRPKKEAVSRVAALPYDVYNRQEACAEVKREPLSFLKIDRAETQFGDEVDTYDDCVYEKARELLDGMIADGTFVEDEESCYYIYELTMNGRAQTGIVACSSIDDYRDGVIKKHENTRADKEVDRIRHVDTCNAQTGPIFLAYRTNERINAVVGQVKKEEALYDFTASDGVRHEVWKIADKKLVQELENGFARIPNTYIADGHHRAASAVKVGFKRREENPGYTGEEEFNYFLSVLFPDDQLMIMDYNRVVKDLNGLSKEEFLEKVQECFDVMEADVFASEAAAAREVQQTVMDSIDQLKQEDAKPLNRNTANAGYSPKKKGEVGMYLDGVWYCLTVKPEFTSDDPVKGLDVSILQDVLLAPVLGIGDPRTDKRIDFIGGIRGLKELERRADSDMKVAFAMYPTSIQELFAVADASLLMPPKSTWFEPKLRSGIFIHRL